ncbi:MAG TPA: creatininase family protein [Gemmatimonadales bacterium]|nr:creatininase family protein [Gemmatimonadales bacterium]
MKEMNPGNLREHLEARPALIVPVGTTEQHGPHLPLGCDTIIVERLADDLSAESGVPRTPTVEYGVHTPTPSFPGGASVSRKTLHRVMNELIESWEVGAGVREFLILTAQANDAHQEALSTIRTEVSQVLVVDIFSLDFTGLLERPDLPVQGGELDTSLLLHIAPDLVRMDLARDYLPPSGRDRFKPGSSKRLPEGFPGSVGYPSLATAEKGERLYTFMLEQVRRCLQQC